MHVGSWLPLPDPCFHYSDAPSGLNNCRWNYLWALGYNCLMIPVAAGVMYPVMRKQVRTLWLHQSFALLPA